MQRYYYKKVGNRYRVHDSSQSAGTDHICIADCSDEWRAAVIVHEMNGGELPYRSSISYNDYVALKSNGTIQFT